MSNTDKNKALKRAKLVLEMINSLFSRDPYREIFCVPESDFWKIPLLNERSMRDSIFQKIERESEHALTFTDNRETLEKLPRLKPGEETMINTGPDRTLYINIQINDKEGLDAYTEDVKLKLQEAEDQITFVLNEKDEKRVRLTRQGGNPATVCDFRRNALRYKTLRQLIGKKKPIQSEVLAKKLGIEIEKVWKTINEIKKQVSRKLGVDLEDFILNERGKGYRLGKVVNEDSLS